MGKGPKQEKPGNASKKTSKNNPKTGIRGNEARGAQYNLGPRLSPENRQANPKRGTKPIQQKPITVLRLNKNRTITF